MGTDPGPLRPYFPDAREVGTVPSGDAVGLNGEPVDTTRIWWLTGRTAPWTQIWTERRSLRVI